MSERWVTGTFLIIVLFLALARPVSNWPVVRFFEGGGNADGGLAAENDVLKARLAVLAGVPAGLSSIQGGVPAAVFVRYPFNFKNELLIDAGEGKGVREGQVVALPFRPDASEAEHPGGAVLLGRVHRAFGGSSLVQTVFDTRFQLGVRIGEQGIESLLAGGSTPKLTLIPKGAEVKPGDIVYAAAEGLPYGLAIGEVRDISLSSGGLLQEATLTFPYELPKVKTVLVLQ